MKNALKIATFVAFIVLTACTNKNSTYKGSENKDIVVLSTNDSYSNYDEFLGYAGVKDFADNIDKKENYITLCDIGNFSTGNAIAEKTKGKATIDIMNKMGYDLVVPGTHEFDYGFDTFLNNMRLLGDKVISCNIIDPRDNRLYFPPYKIFTYGDTKVAYIGVTSPETFNTLDENTKKLVSFFEDTTGESLCFQIQRTVDAARKKGADKIILLSHLGNKNVKNIWSSFTVIANTVGIDAVMDAHSAEIMEEAYMLNRNGNFVPIVQAGDNLQFIGAMNITKDGFLNPAIISKKSATGKDPKISEFIEKIKKENE